MNTKLNPLFNRRSIRKYLNRPIPKDFIQDLLEAAMAAPSAVGKDPWEWMVIQNKEQLRQIATALPNGGMLAYAPLGFVLCGSLERANGHELSYLLQDCAASIENLLIAASLLGLGACWLGVHPRLERIAHIKSLFSLPEGIVPVACVAVGYPAETKQAQTRYNPRYVHWEKW